MEENVSHGRIQAISANLGAKHIRMILASSATQCKTGAWNKLNRFECWNGELVSEHFLFILLQAGSRPLKTELCRPRQHNARAWPCYPGLSPPIQPLSLKFTRKGFWLGGRVSSRFTRTRVVLFSHRKPWNLAPATAVSIKAHVNWKKPQALSLEAEVAWGCL